MPLAKLLLSLFVMMEPANAEPGYMGINPAPLNDAMRKEYRVANDVKSGLVLIQVFDGTAAKRAGLRRGDVLTKFAEKPVRSIEDLMGLLKNKKAGQKVSYVARRGSGTIAGILVLGKRPKEPRVVSVPAREAPKAAERPANEGDLQRRMDRLQRDIEIARKQAAERAAQREKQRKRPTTWKGLMEREERGLERAKKAGNRERVLWHSARLELLREMGQPKKPNANKRVAELEAQIQRVLERLERLEKSLK